MVDLAISQFWRLIENLAARGNEFLVGFPKLIFAEHYDAVTVLVATTSETVEQFLASLRVRQSHQGLVIFVQMCYIACMSKQYNTSERSEEQHKTKERIIAAASKVLAEKGYDATTLREISREAQAAQGLVHYYFGGKDELLVEALQAAGQQFHQRMEDLAQHMSTNWSLDALLRELYERVDLEPEVYRLRYESFSLGLHNPVIEPKVRERLAQRRDEIGSIIARALENMERTENVKRISLDPTILAALLLSIFDGLALQKIMDPTFDLEAAYRLLAQMLQGLLGGSRVEGSV